MKKIDRRSFIRAGIAGMTGLTIAQSSLAEMRYFLPSDEMMDNVKLGNSGLEVSRVAMGTGTVGYNKGSNQTRLGMDNFVKLARHAYDRGIRFYDTADGYGSLPYVAEAMKSIPRESYTMLSKIWTYEDGSDKNEPVDKTLDRFRKEGNTDYFDVILLHCMQAGGWTKNRTHYMDGLSKAKQDGIVKAVGVSCHNYDALVEAAESPWVDVIMARLNPFNSHMDNTLEAVNETLGKALKNGKGVIAMKIFGEGKHVQEHEREQSIKFALSEGNISCMTLGLESIAQMDDALERVLRLKAQ